MKSLTSILFLSLLISCSKSADKAAQALNGGGSGDEGGIPTLSVNEQKKSMKVKVEDSKKEFKKDLAASSHKLDMSELEELKNEGVLSKEDMAALDDLIQEDSDTQDL